MVVADLRGEGVVLPDTMPRVSQLCSYCGVLRRTAPCVAWVGGKATDSPKPFPLNPGIQVAVKVLASLNAGW